MMLAAATFVLAGADPWLEQMMTGNRLRLSGDAAGAEKYYLTALEIARSLGVDHVRYGQTLNNLAVLYQDRGDYARAEPLLLRALAVKEKALGPMHHELALCLTNLGALYGAMHRIPDAAAAYQRAVDVGERQRGAGEGPLAIALGNLGALYFEAGRLESAEPLLRRALPLAEQVLAPNHSKTVLIMLFLANIEYARGNYSRAEAGWSRALSAIESSPVPDRITAATLRMNLGELKRFELRFAESELLLGSAIAEFEKNGNGAHPLLPTALNHLALTYLEQGKASEAEPVYLRALAIVERRPDPSPPARKQHAVILNNLGRLREQQSALLEAADLFRRALESAEAGYGPGHPSLKLFLHDSARLLRTLRRGREADALEQRAKRVAAPDLSRHTVDLRDLRRLEADRRQR